MSSESSEDNSSSDTKKRKRHAKWHVYTHINHDEKLMTINVVGEIVQKMADKIFEALDDAVENNVKRVVFYINSGGGHSDAGFGIYNHLKVYKKSFKIASVGIGEVASSALDFFLASDEKYCTADCEIMVHGIKYANKNVEKLWNNKMINMFAKRTKRSKNYWHDRLLTGDHVYTPEDAVNVGLIDDIIDISKV